MTMTTPKFDLTTKAGIGKAAECILRNGGIQQ